MDSNSELAKLARIYMDAHGLNSRKSAKVPKALIGRVYLVGRSKLLLEAI